jgi:hypothetical protein
MNSPGTSRHNHLDIKALLIVASGVANAAEIPVSFDHAKPNVVTEISVDPGDRIRVAIANTCAEHFLYEVREFKPSPSPGVAPPAPLVPAATCAEKDAESALINAGYCKQALRPLTFIHESGTRTYQILVTKKPNAPTTVRGLQDAEWNQAIETMKTQPTCTVPAGLGAKADLLDDVAYLLNIEKSPWALGMSGGLSISEVVDPRFAVISDPASTATPAATIVVRNRDAEDSQKLGFAGFVHVHNEHWVLKDIPIAATFGLGVQDDDAISGFAGVSFAAFDLAYLTVGYNWSSVDRLPTGQRLGATPISDNVLNDLPSKTDNGWFLGISFKFMSPEESFYTGKFKKKSAPVEGGTPASQ